MYYIMLQKETHQLLDLKTYEHQLDWMEIKIMFHKAEFTSFFQIFMGNSFQLLFKDHWNKWKIKF